MKTRYPLRYFPSLHQSVLHFGADLLLKYFLSLKPQNHTSVSFGLKGNIIGSLKICSIMSFFNQRFRGKNKNTNFDTTMMDCKSKQNPLIDLWMLLQTNLKLYATMKYKEELEIKSWEGYLPLPHEKFSCAFLSTMILEYIF